MYVGRTTLAKFLLEQLREQPDGELLAALVVDVAAGVRNVATLAARPRLNDPYGSLHALTAAGLGLRIAPFEGAQPLETAANEAILRHCESSGLVAGLASELTPEPTVVHEVHRRGPYLLNFDALEGTANLDVDASIGTVFSVLPHDSHLPPSTADFLQPGIAQVAAGYAIYGPATMLVLSVGQGTHGFTLDREFNNFILTHPDLRIPNETRELAVDTSHERFWESPVARYVGECKAGRAGARGQDFTMRWFGSAVAEVHRILMRGGVFVDPLPARDAPRPARMWLAGEAHPLAMLVEQAGGLASTGRGPLLELVPGSLHERAPVVLGSRDEVARIERYHHEHDRGADRPYRSPLFGERSLFRNESAGVCGRAGTCPQSTL